MGDLAVAFTAADAYGVGHLIVAGLGIGVADRLSSSSLSVTEIPLVTADLLSVGCRGCAGELGRFAFANRSVGEIGGWLPVNSNGFGDLVSTMSASCNSKGHLVSTGLGVCMARILS